MPAAASLPVRGKRAEDQAWVESLLRARWGDTLVAVHDELLDAASLPALIAGERRGLATWRHLGGNAAELVTLDALPQRQGIGTALVASLADRLRSDGMTVQRVTTTNDNLDALRFYQRRRFCIAAVRLRAVEVARRRKPSIPAVGTYGIPLRDEIELSLDLAGAL